MLNQPLEYKVFTNPDSLTVAPKRQICFVLQEAAVAHCSAQGVGIRFGNLSRYAHNHCWLKSVFDEQPCAMIETHAELTISQQRPLLSIKKFPIQMSADLTT